MINNPNQKRKILKNIKRLTMKKYKSTLLNIYSSIFRNIKRKDMFVQKKTINENFKPPTGRGRFLQKIKNDVCKGKSWL